MRRYGKKPFVADPRDLVFVNYRSGAPLPKHPASFGHDDLVNDWGMLGNDEAGNCAEAGAVHWFMECCAEGGAPISATTESAIGLYKAVTGYNPADPSSDQGTVVREMLKYLRQDGYVDGAGRTHKILGFVRVDHTSLEQLQEAAWLFSGVIMGFQLPQSAEDQFDAGKPWSVVRGSPTVGGHAVFVPRFEPYARQGVLGAIADAVAGKRIQGVGITWGKPEVIEQGFFGQKADEAWALFTDEGLKNGRSLEGFDKATLLADLRAVAA